MTRSGPSPLGLRAAAIALSALASCGAPASHLASGVAVPPAVPDRPAAPQRISLARKNAECFAVDPAGARVAVGRGDGSVDVFDASGKQVAHAALATVAVAALAWSVRASLYAALDDGRIFVLEGSLQSPRQVHDAGRRISAMAANGSGDRLAVAVSDDHVEILDGATGALRAPLWDSQGPPSSIAWRDDAILAIGGVLGASVWNARTATRLAELGPWSATEIAWSDDGATIATAGTDGSTRLWDGEELRFAKDVEAADESLHAPHIAFRAHDTELIALDLAGTSRVWTLDSREARSGPTLGPAFTFASLADGAFVVLTSQSDVDIVRDPAWAERRAPPSRPPFKAEGYVRLGPPPPMGRIEGVAWRPDGARVAATAVEFEDTVRIFDPASGEIASTLTQRGRFFGADVAYSPDGATLAETTSRGTLELWDVDRGAVRRSVPVGDGTVESLAYSPDGAVIATTRPGPGGAIVALWDASTGDAVATLPTCAARRVAWSARPDRLGVLCAGGTLEVWNPATRAIVRRVRGPHPLGAFAFAPGGARLALEASDPPASQAERPTTFDRIVVQETDTGRVVTSLAGDEQVGSRPVLAWSPDGAQLVSIGSSLGLSRWDLATGKRAASKGHGYDGPWGYVTSIAWSPHGDMFVTGSLDTTVLAWSAQPADQPLRVLGGD